MKILTKYDILLIIAITIIAFSIYFFVTVALKEPVTNGVVKVYYENEVYKTITLYEDNTYSFSTDLGENEIEVKDGKVKMINADCRDHLCLYEGEIEYNNQSIICLPNKLVVKIENDKESELDSIAR